MAEYGNSTTGPRKQTAREEQIIATAMQEFGQLQLMRNTFAMHWEEVAELILPTSRNTFFYGNFNWQGVKKTDRQVDASGALALSRFAAICNSLLTPRNMKWHKLEANDPYVMKDRASRLWFEQVTDLLFRYRYSQFANFTGQNGANFTSLGAFGNATMFIDEFDGTNYGPVRGIRYRGVPLGETFYRENHQGLVDGMIRWFRLTARQAMQKWGDANFPEALRSALESNSEWPFNFLHRVCPRDDYDPSRLDARGKPFTSQYISIEGGTLLAEGGYRTFPYATSRYEQTPGESYGRGPAMQVLPALKTLNAEKRTFLKQGHRAADPVLLTYDDGLMSMDLTPGAMNPGGMSADGKPLVGILPTGKIEISKEMMQEEKALINDAFYVTLFQILTETPQMTATEVIERVNEKGMLLAPTVGHQSDEYLGPMIERELDVLASQNLLPPMPPRLLEAKGAYRVEYTSPLAKSMKAGEASGFFRTIENFKEIAIATGDPSILDVFDFDTAGPAIANIQNVPESWMATEGQIAVKRKGRAQAQAQQAQIQAMPAQAAMMKAQAVAQQAGGGQPQQGQPPQGQPQGQ